MSLVFENITLTQLPQIAAAIFLAHPQARIFLLDGEMGSGKTTLIKALCAQLGSRDSFSSPTYSIVNEYAIAGSPTRIYHMDLYRLKTLEEALSIGIEEYISGSDYCFIEWPQLIEHFVRDAVWVKIEGVGEERRVSF